jgi:hypothetical protein
LEEAPRGDSPFGILMILPDCTPSRFAAAEFPKSYARSLSLLGSCLADKNFLKKNIWALIR